MCSAVGEELARTVYHYEHGSFEMVALRADRLSKFELSVHDRFLWASREDIAPLRLAPADVALVGQLIEQGHWG